MNLLIFYPQNMHWMHLVHLLVVITMQAIFKYTYEEYSIFLLPFRSSFTENGVSLWGCGFVRYE